MSFVRKTAKRLMGMKWGAITYSLSGTLLQATRWKCSSMKPKIYQNEWYRSVFSLRQFSIVKQLRTTCNTTLSTAKKPTLVRAPSKRHCM